MKVFEEITQWDTATPNHVYLMNDSKEKIYAYVRASDRAVFHFDKPIKIDARGRKFREVENTWGFDLEAKKSKIPQWQFAGSRGDTYVVQLVEDQLQCSCPGFTFRGDCKHVKMVDQKIPKNV